MSEKRSWSVKPREEMNAETVQAVQMLTSEIGYPPTVREVMEYLGLHSSASAKNRIDLAIEAGLLERGPKGSPRTLLITQGDQ